MINMKLWYLLRPLPCKKTVRAVHINLWHVLCSAFFHLYCQLCSFYLGFYARQLYWQVLLSAYQLWQFCPSVSTRYRFKPR